MIPASPHISSFPENPKTCGGADLFQPGVPMAFKASLSNVGIPGDLKKFISFHTGKHRQKVD